MIKRLKNNNGSFAIISAILIFIVIMCISAYTDMTSKRWVVNEVQGIMDISGTNTLKSTVDKDSLFKEILASDPQNPIDANIKQVDTLEYKKKIINTYKKEIKSQVSTNETITALDVKDVDVYFDYDKFGLGTSSKSHPQITLKSVTKLKIKSYSFLDGLDGADAKVYNSRNNEEFRVVYSGEKEDGQVELLVYSVTRLVYR